MGSLSSEDDQARFRSVVLPHLAQAYALARWLTGDRADAEDVVQEACLRAFRGIGGFSGVNPRAWLLTIVRHAAYTWLGKNRSRSLLMVDDLEAVERKQASAGALSEQGPETPEAALIAKADAARLESAIAGLPVQIGLYTVFVPSAPTPAAGSIYYLPEDRIKILNVPVSSAVACVTRLGLGSRELLARELAQLIPPKAEASDD